MRKFPQNPHVALWGWNGQGVDEKRWFYGKNFHKNVAKDAERGLWGVRNGRQKQSGRLGADFLDPGEFYQFFQKNLSLITKSRIITGLRRITQAGGFSWGSIDPIIRLSFDYPCLILFPLIRP
jgi:hypothetical protein